jgi:hypothetical protein
LESGSGGGVVDFQTGAEKKLAARLAQDALTTNRHELTTTGGTRSPSAFPKIIFGHGDCQALGRPGLEAPVENFNWDTFDNPGAEDWITITTGDMIQVFEGGSKQLSRAAAAKALQAVTGAGRTAAYAALKLDGRFGNQLHEENHLLSWRP